VSEQRVADVTWLTQDAYDRLRGELDELSGPVRTDIISRIESARAEGDLKENGGYHAAKDEQGKVEARIRQLTELLRHAQVGETPDTGGKAGPGMVLEVRFGGETATETFLIGSREDAGLHDTLDVYSPRSPLGHAVTGHAAGETVHYETPNGRQMSVEIIRVEPYQG
jgi:transcription elongation factor GreA